MFACNNKSHLFQNIPNPASDATTIPYFLANGIENAAITVADYSGKMVKSFTLHQTGFGQVNLETMDLPAGTYVFSLVVENEIVTSHKMILVK